MMAPGFQAVPFESTRILRLQPGDVVVLRVAMSDLSEAEHQDVMDRAKVFFPDHKVMVLEPGAELEVFRKD
jgi:hypothetical protein